MVVTVREIKKIVTMVERGLRGPALELRITHLLGQFQEPFIQVIEPQEIKDPVAFIDGASTFKET